MLPCTNIAGRVKFLSGGWGLGALGSTGLVLPPHVEPYSAVFALSFLSTVKGKGPWKKCTRLVIPLIGLRAPE